MKSTEEILAIDDVPTKIIEVPEWGTSLTLRQLPLEVAMQLAETQEPTSTRIKKVILAGVVNEDGTPKFEELHWSQLSRKNANVLMRISTEITGLSTQTTVAQAEKN